MGLIVLLIAASGAWAQQAPGLVASYTDGSRTVRVVVPTPNFALESGESIHPSLTPEFTAEYRGFLSVLRAGEYRFDPGPAQLSINGNAVRGGAVTSLTAGMHPIALRYRRTTGVARLRLVWQGTDFLTEPVPASLLFHRQAEEPSREERLTERGRTLVEEFGCANCHEAAGLKSAGPDLSGLGSRVKREWIEAWLASPQGFRQGARMPVMLDGQQRSDVAAYLASLGGPAPAPSRRSGGSVGKGGELFGTLGCLACHQEAGLELRGLGSKWNLAALAAFLRDPSKIEPSGRMPSMLLTENEAQAIAAHLVTSRNAEFERAAQTGDTGRGKELIETAGCLACHALREAGAGGDAYRTPPLARLPEAGGCLAPEPRPGLPRYTLTNEQREAIALFLNRWRVAPDRSPAPVYRLRRLLAEMRCVACHRTNAGGPSAELAESAPTLEGAGGKLKTEWIAEVLSRGKRVWGGQEIRMPHYTPSQAAPLAEAFAKAEGLLPGDGALPPQVSEATRDRGLGLLGTNPKKGGMGCIGCHDWGENKALGEEGPQLLDVAGRVRWDWFERWMRDPTRILSGTSMPNYFRSMEAAKATEVLSSLWAGMSGGSDVPEGYRIVIPDAEAKPVPGRNEAVVVRWDMPEATPAAIAVGLPGGLSYCFDAGESRLRYAWHGGFLDLTGTLLRKTDKNRLTPTAELIGEVFWRGEEFPLRVGDPERVPQRRFRGYRIVEGMPQFRYQVDGIDVYERLSPLAGQAAIRREFVVSKVEQPVWFLAGPGQARRIPSGTNVKFEAVITREAR